MNLSDEEAGFTKEQIEQRMNDKKNSRPSMVFDCVKWVLTITMMAIGFLLGGMLLGVFFIRVLGPIFVWMVELKI